MFSFAENSLRNFYLFDVSVCCCGVSKSTHENLFVRRLNYAKKIELKRKKESTADKSNVNLGSLRWWKGKEGMEIRSVWRDLVQKPHCSSYFNLVISGVEVIRVDSRHFKVVSHRFTFRQQSTILIQEWKPLTIQFSFINLQAFHSISLLT